MVSFPLYVSQCEDQPQRFELFAIRKGDLSGKQFCTTAGSPWPLSSNAGVILESAGQKDDSITSPAGVTNALRNARFQRLPIVAPTTQEARWFIVSFLTVPKSDHKQVLSMFEIYVNEIFANPKFKPVFQYLAPNAPESDVLLSVWGFGSSQDADVYMPSPEHIEFGNSVKSFIKHADFFQAKLVDVKGANL